MTNAELLTVPAQLRSARYVSEDDASYTAEFLSEIRAVIASSKAFTSDVNAPSSTRIQEDPESGESRVPRRVNELLQRKQPKRVHFEPGANERYRMLAKYDGFVVSRDTESFVARLFENGSDYPVLEAEFGIEDVSESERQRAVPGAPLTWTMSYRHEGGTVFRDSRIYFRRTEWTPEGLRAAREAAAALTDGLDWEPHPRASE